MYFRLPDGNFFKIINPMRIKILISSFTLLLLLSLQAISQGSFSAIGGTGDERIRERGFQQTGDGGFIFAGYTSGFGAPAGGDGLLIKKTSAGVIS